MPNQTQTTDNSDLKWYRDWFLTSVIVLVVFADQLSKYFIKSLLDLHESWPSDGFLRLTHGFNSGTAFGLFPNQTNLLIFLSIVAIGFIYYFYRTQALTSKLLRIALGLQLGGALGNLSDRLRTGGVVDFFDVGWWPIFNIADSSIVIGMILLAWVIVFNSGTNNSRERKNHMKTDEY